MANSQQIDEEGFLFNIRKKKYWLYLKILTILKMILQIVNRL